LIQERQKIESQRQLALDQKSAQDTFDLKNEWEKRTGNIIRVRHTVTTLLTNINNNVKNRTIQRKVEKKLFESELKLEERKNALSALLLKEEEDYAKELEIHFR